MSNIFGNVEPPAWLQAIAKPVDAREAGAELGTALGAGLLAFQPDPDAAPDPKTGKVPAMGFQKGLYTARMNQQDPQWKVKEAGLVAGVSEKWATAATTWQSYTDKSRDDALWASKELGEVTKWRDELKTNPKAIAPIVTTPKGQQAVQQIQTGEWRKAQLQSAADIKKAQIENGSVAAKVATRHTESFLQALDTLPPDAAASIGEPKGPKIAGQETYSAEQWDILKTELGKAGLPMPGTKTTSQVSEETKVQLEDLRSQEQDIRKEIISSAGDDVKVKALRRQLGDVQKQRRDIAAGKQAATTEPDENAEDIQSKRDAYKSALLGDDPDKIKSAEKDLQTAQIKAGRAKALDAGYVIDSAHVDKSTIDQMKTWPKGTQFYDSETKKWKVFDPALLPAFEAQLNPKPTTDAKTDRETKSWMKTHPTGYRNKP